MLSGARLALRLPRPGFRAFATRNTPPGPRGRLNRAVPSKSARKPPLRRNSASNLPQKDAEAAKAASNLPPNSSTPSNDASSSPPEPSKNEAVSNALANVPDAQNPLITPVHIPEDAHAILKETHPVMRLLDNSAIVIQRQIEMMNVLVGFEQANRYIIMDPHGNHIGYLAEQDHGIGSSITRQMFKTHRSFTTHVFDREEKEVLRFHRPFSWISSQIRVYDAVGGGSGGGEYTHSVALQGTSTGSVVNQTSASVSSLKPEEMRIIGSADQEWAMLRRKYNLYLARDIDASPAAPDTPQIASGDLPLSNSKALQIVEGDQRQPGMMQFARIDEPMLSWDFSLMSEDGRKIGSVNRNFAGFARELFTDTGVYALRMDAAGLAIDGTQNEPHVIDHHPGMTLDQRAVMLATAVSVDFDYFSRHSGGVGGGMWPLWMPWFGGGGEAAGGAAAGGAAAGEAGVIGAAGAAGESGVAGEAAGALGRAGAGEAAAVGAGSMAGYEAMRGARGQTQEVDDMSPQADQYQPPADPGGQGDVWGQGGNDPWGGAGEQGGQDFWGGGGGGGNNGGNSGGGGGGEGGGGGGFDFDDWF